MFSQLSYLQYSVYVVSLRLWKPHFRVHEASQPHFVKKPAWMVQIFLSATSIPLMNEHIQGWSRIISRENSCYPFLPWRLGLSCGRSKDTAGCLKFEISAYKRPTETVRLHWVTTNKIHELKAIFANSYGNYFICYIVATNFSCSNYFLYSATNNLSNL